MATYRASAAGGGSGGTSNRSVSIVPAVGDLIVVFVAASANSNATPTCSDDNSGTYTLLGTFPVSVNMTSCFVRDALCTNTTSTLITAATGSNTSGEVVAVAVSGMVRTGAAAKRQFVSAGGGSFEAPTVSFSAATLTANLTLMAVTNVSAAGEIAPPIGWTERQDVSQTNPTLGLEVSTRDSGFAATTLTCTSNSSSSYAALALELDTSSLASTATEGSATAADVPAVLAAFASLAAEGTASAAATQLTTWVTAAATVEGSASATDSTNFGIGQAASIVEGVATATDSVAATPSLPASLAEGAPSASDSTSAIGSLKGSITEAGAANAITDASIGGVVHAVSIVEGSATAADSPRTATLTDIFPIADIVAGGWTPSVGGTLYGTMDELTVNHADYIRSPATTAAFEELLDSFGDPGTDELHGIDIGLEAKNIDTDFTMQLMQGATQLDGWTEDVAVAMGPIVRTHNFAAAVIASVTDRADLRIRGRIADMQHIYVQRDFGAVGDGVHDDTANINAALAAVDPNRGKILVFEPGRYLVPNGITETKDGLVVIGLGHVGYGPTVSTSAMGVQIYTTGAGKWCWDKGYATTNDYAGGTFENICFCGTSATAGGLRTRMGHTIVKECGAIGHTTGIGFLSVCPTSPGNQAGLSRFNDCTTQDCLHGFQAGDSLGGAAYTHFTNCYALKFTAGGIVHTGTGIRMYDSGSCVIGGHFESHDIGIQCLQSFGCRIIGPFFEDNTTWDISLERTSGSSGTRNLIVCTTSKINVGAFQVGDVIVGGDSQTMTDNGSQTMLIGHETVRLPYSALTGPPTGGVNGDSQIRDSRFYYKAGGAWRGILGS